MARQAKAGNGATNGEAPADKTGAKEKNQPESKEPAKVVQLPEDLSIDERTRRIRLMMQGVNVNATGDEVIGSMARSKFVRFDEQMSSTKQKADDARMEHASTVKDFKESGGNSWAHKIVVRLRKQDQDKTKADLHALMSYIRFFGLDGLLQDVPGLNDMLPGLKDVEAMGMIDGADGVDRGNNPFRVLADVYDEAWAKGQAKNVKGAEAAPLTGKDAAAEQGKTDA